MTGPPGHAILADGRGQWMGTLEGLRQRAGLTQQQAAKKLGWAPTLNKLESGVPAVTSRRQYGRLAKLYKVTFDDMEGAVKSAQRKRTRRR